MAQEREFVPITKEALKGCPNYVNSLKKAIEGMAAFEDKEGKNNMIQNIESFEITRPVFITKEGEQAKSPISAENLVNLMHVQLSIGKRQDPAFMSAGSARAGFLKAKDGVEPTYVVLQNSKTNAISEVKMFHVSQLEVDQVALDKFNLGRNPKAKALDLSKLVTKVPARLQKDAVQLRQSIARGVEREGGSIAKMDVDKAVDMIVGYGLQQKARETRRERINYHIYQAQRGMSDEQKAAFTTSYGIAKEARFAKEKDEKNQTPLKEVFAEIDAIAAEVKGMVQSMEAPAKEAAVEAPKKAPKKKEKAKEAPAR